MLPSRETHTPRLLTHDWVMNEFRLSFDGGEKAPSNVRSEHGSTLPNSSVALARTVLQRVFKLNRFSTSHFIFYGFVASD